MCGIAGFSGYYQQDLLSMMGNIISHRGPDDAGDILLLHHNNQVGLAHRRLSIIDLSSDGHQPMTVNCECCNNTTEKRLWLTYNGELYNYRELRSELTAKGHRFTSKTDSEVLLHLYAEDGPSMLKRLNGIFAFAIYDGRNDQKHHTMKAGDLFLARDGVGVKPLYYAKTPSGFLFASELKALLACDEVKTELDRTAIHYYLSYLWCPGQQTALQSVKKMQPGEAMIVRHGHIATRWYFYDFPYEGTQLQQGEDEICAELDRKLTAAVDRQLVSDVSVGGFLSGGLDSSALIAIMRKLRPQEKINCYCIGLNDSMKSEGNPDDVPYAKSVAKHLNVNLTLLEVNANMIENLQSMLYHLDEPQADLAPIHVYLIAKAAQRDGLKVLLSGAGGDDIFSGYRRHQAIHMERFWKWVPLSMRRQISTYAGHILEGKNSRYNMQYSAIRRFAKLFANAQFPVDRQIVNHFIWNTETLRRTLYSDEMANHVGHIDTALPLLCTLQRIPDECDPLNRMLYLEGKHFLPDHNLNYTDKMSMAMGVEVRVPLLDRDLIKYAVQIPTHLKQKRNVTKSIFKKTMEPYLPKATIYRTKAGFGAPLRRWLHQELQPLIHEVLSDSAIKNRGIFDAKAVAKLMRWDKEGRVDAAYTIFSVLCIELWSQLFVDGSIL